MVTHYLISWRKITIYHFGLVIASIDHQSNRSLTYHDDSGNAQNLYILRDLTACLLEMYSTCVDKFWNADNFPHDFSGFEAKAPFAIRCSVSLVCAPAYHGRSEQSAKNWSLSLGDKWLSSYISPTTDASSEKHVGKILLDLPRSRICWLCVCGLSEIPVPESGSNTDHQPNKNTS